VAFDAFLITMAAEWYDLRYASERVFTDQMGVADPGGSQQAVGCNDDGGCNQWQFHDVTSLARSKGRAGGYTAALRFILGLAEVNLKPGLVISVTARNNFGLERAGIGKKPLKNQGHALLERHLAPTARN
jgi:hypothetical protein